MDPSRESPRRTSGYHDRSRYSSVNIGERSRYYGDQERYARSRTVDGRINVDHPDRYGRSRSREAPRDDNYNRYRTGGSADRFHQSRSRMTSSPYGDPYGEPYPRRFMEERYPRPEYPERYSRYRDLDYIRYPRESIHYYRDDFDRSHFGYEPRFDRYAYPFDRFGLYRRFDYGRPNYAYDYPSFDRFAYGPRYGPSMYGYGSRYGLDRSLYEGRYLFDRF